MCKAISKQLSSIGLARLNKYFQQPSNRVSLAKSQGYWANNGYKATALLFPEPPVSATSQDRYHAPLPIITPCSRKMQTKQTKQLI